MQSRDQFSVRPDRPDPAGSDGGAVFRAPAPRRHLDPAAMARRLSSAVHWPGASDVTVRSWRLVARACDFDAWLIAWPHGGTVDLHDHGGSRGALHVISGSLVETIPDPDGAGRVAFARKELHAGVTLGFGAGHVHDVQNEASDHALSLHVYSPPLTSMMYYDRVGDHLLVRQNGWAASAFDATADDTPAWGIVAR